LKQETQNDDLACSVVVGDNAFARGVLSSSSRRCIVVIVGIVLFVVTITAAVAFLLVGGDESGTTKMTLVATAAEARRNAPTPTTRTPRRDLSEHHTSWMFGRRENEQFRYCGGDCTVGPILPHADAAACLPASTYPTTTDGWDRGCCSTNLLLPTVKLHGAGGRGKAPTTAGGC